MSVQYDDAGYTYDDIRTLFDGNLEDIYFVHTGGGSDVFITPAGPESGYHGGPDPWR